MFAKLLLIILTVVLTAAALLATRQQQIDTVHEMTQRHRRLVEGQTAMWILHARIANHCRPEEVRKAVDRLGGEWAAIPNEPVHDDQGMSADAAEFIYVEQADAGGG